MKLTQAIDRATERATRITGHEIYIVARVFLCRTPSGYIHNVDYDLANAPRLNTVGIVHTDGSFAPMTR